MTVIWKVPDGSPLKRNDPPPSVTTVRCDLEGSLTRVTSAPTMTWPSGAATIPATLAPVFDGELEVALGNAFVRPDEGDGMPIDCDRAERASAPARIPVKIRRARFLKVRMRGRPRVFSHSILICAGERAAAEDASREKRLGQIVVLVARRGDLRFKLDNIFD